MEAKETPRSNREYFFLVNHPIYKNTLFILLALSALFTLIWACLVTFYKPYSGLTWSSTTDIVTSVDPNGLSEGSIGIDDQMHAVDGSEVYDARDFLNGFTNEMAETTVERDLETISVPLRPTQPSLLTVLNRLSPLLVAFIFWLVGAFALRFGRQDRLTIQFFLFCWLITVIIGLGSISPHAPIWVTWAFSLMLWWAGPLIIHTHTLLAGYGKNIKVERAIKYLYGMALLFSILDFWRLLQGALGPLLIIKIMWLGLALLVAGFLIYIGSGQKAAPDIRRRNRIVGLASLMAFAPIVLLSLFPNAVYGEPILSYEMSSLAFPVLAFGYIYAIHRFKLIHLEPYINRTAAYGLAVLMVAAIYGAIYLSSSQLIHVNQPAIFIILLVTTLILVFTAYPLYYFIQRQVDRVFYGVWYDDLETVNLLGQSLQKVSGNIEDIIANLCQALHKVLQVEYASVLLFNGNLISSGKQRHSTKACRSMFEPIELKDWFSDLHNKRGSEIGPGADLVETTPLSASVINNIFGKNPQLWLLLSGRSEYLGLLVVGPIRGGGIFLSKHMEMLEVVVRQASVALENQMLLREARQHAEQIKEMHRQVLLAREEERKWVARDLHDKTIQRLVGIHYHLANLRNRLDTSTATEFHTYETELRSTMEELRRICTGLRPPEIEIFGLEHSIQTRLDEIKDQVPFNVYLEMDGLDGVEISEEAGTSLYRFINEGIINAFRHADANNVWVRLKVTPAYRVTVAVEDDGRGFQLPTNINVFTNKGHFGLVGLKELVELAGGEMSIQSKPGEGCSISAYIPINDSADRVKRK